MTANNAEEEAQADEPEEGSYVVERILDMRGPPTRRLFLVKWKNWPESANTWEPEEHLDNCNEIVTDFLSTYELTHPPKQNSRKPKPKPKRKPAVPQFSPYTMVPTWSHLGSDPCPTMFVPFPQGLPWPPQHLLAYWVPRPGPPGLPATPRKSPATDDAPRKSSPPQMPRANPPPPPMPRANPPPPSPPAEDHSIIILGRTSDQPDQFKVLRGKTEVVMARDDLVARYTQAYIMFLEDDCFRGRF